MCVCVCVCVRAHAHVRILSIVLIELGRQIKHPNLILNSKLYSLHYSSEFF